MVVEVTDKNFEAEVLKSDVPVLLDFFANWCGPCKMLSPVLEELSGDYEGKIKIAKLDTDQSQQTAAKFGISSIPCVLLFKDGKEVERLVGFRPKAAFDQVLGNYSS